jgi:phosphopentomutase
MARVIILLLDSFGIGSSEDAVLYGDSGADTFKHIVEFCQDSKTTVHRKLPGPIRLPNLAKRGLFAASRLSRNEPLSPSDTNCIEHSQYGYCVEISHGKDTPSGHWEIAGVPVLFDWGYFPDTVPTFPDDLIKTFIEKAKLPGILGNCHASGTVIIEELGEEHIKTGKPIVYTSADSVFQIAAHEQVFGLERLYEISQIARELIEPLNIGRVIARPFLGTKGHFYRTGNRKDYSMPPPASTLLEKLTAAHGKVIAIGKTADIFAHRGISKEIKANGNMAIFDETLKAVATADDNTLIFSNFVDFDSSFGHRRDTDGYAAALEQLDERLPELDNLLKEDDLVIITADHGCDPTWIGTDHTREHIPLLVYNNYLRPGSLGKRTTFADIGQTLAEFFNLSKFNHGSSFLDKLRDLD